MPVKSARKKGAVKLKKSKNPTIKRLKRALSLVLVFGGSALFLFSLTIVKEFNQNLTSALTPSKTVFMESGYPTVLYVTVEDVSATPVKVTNLEFKIFDIDGKKIISYEIPTDYELDMPGRLGYEKLSNIFVISDLNTNDGKSSLESGVTALNNSMLPIFGLKAERYVMVDAKLKDSVTKFWSEGDIGLFFNKEFMTSLPRHFRSDFSAKEMLKLGDFINSLPSDRIITNKYLYSYIKDTDVIDQEIRELMLLSQISKEGYSIAILNGAGKAGFAAFGARIVVNNGGRVVAVNNSDEDITESVIIADVQDSLTVRKMASLFGIDNIITKEKARQTLKDSELDRADVIIVMGFDLADSL